MQWRSLVLAAAFLAPGSLVFAQGMPSPQQIEAMIQQGLEQIPETTSEIEGLVKFTYKPIPTDPKDLAKMAGSSLPAGLGSPEQLAKQYAPMIQKYLNKYLADAGTMEVAEGKTLKLRSKTIPAGKHKFGFLVKGQVIKAMVIRYKEGDKEKSLKLGFKSKKTQASQDLKITPAKDKKKPDRIYINLNFYFQVSRSAGYFKEG